MKQMKRLAHHALAYVLLMSASGCCTFLPCHFGTQAVGHVSDQRGNPIKGATVTLYGYKQITDSKGCFYFNTADALPFTLSATADGYKHIEVPSKWGSFSIAVQLAPVSSQEISDVQWKEIDSKESAKPCH